MGLRYTRLGACTATLKDGMGIEKRSPASRRDVRAGEDSSKVRYEGRDLMMACLNWPLLVRSIAHTVSYTLLPSPHSLPSKWPLGHLPLIRLVRQLLAVMLTPQLTPISTSPTRKNSPPRKMTKATMGTFLLSVLHQQPSSLSPHNHIPTFI